MTPDELEAGRKAAAQAAVMRDQLARRRAARTALRAELDDELARALEPDDELSL